MGIDQELEKLKREHRVAFELKEMAYERYELACDRVDRAYEAMQVNESSQEASNALKRLMEERDRLEKVLEQRQTEYFKAGDRLQRRSMELV